MDQTGDKIFLDCGGNDGCSVRRFLATFPAAKDFTIHTFEPNPAFASHYRKFANLSFHNEAVWISDGHLPFYFSKTDRQDGSSLYRNKKSGNLDKENYLNVKCIDFSSWIMDNFSRDQYIILKMDIEGAEYEVLSKMVRDGTMEYINKLFIEFHFEKIDIAPEHHTELLDQLNRFDCKILAWDALGY